MYNNLLFNLQHRWETLSVYQLSAVTSYPLHQVGQDKWIHTPHAPSSNTSRYNTCQTITIHWSYLLSNISLTPALELHELWQKKQTKALGTAICSDLFRCAKYYILFYRYYSLKKILSKETTVTKYITETKETIYMDKDVADKKDRHT